MSPCRRTPPQKVDAQLQIGSATETLEVTAETPQLQTSNADVGITYNDTYVEDLPVLNRNFTTFQLMSPGTQKLAGWSHAATENPQGGQQIMVQGQHFSGTGFQLDGTDNQDPILGIIVINPEPGCDYRSYGRIAELRRRAGQSGRRSGDRADQVGYQPAAW